MNGPYVFQVSYQNIDFKQIALWDTIQENTLIRKKIAPGTQGSFEIQLIANRKMNYQIQFEDTNSKPQNLVFGIEGKDRKYKNLKDMEMDLQGKIEGNKRIIINWQWEYEQSQKTDWQDTKDGETIKQYQFIIYAIGKQ